MKTKRLSIFVVALGLVLLTAGGAQLPEKIRVLSCDLGQAKGESVELKRLLDKADPDIIFLQGAADWENCDRICKLRPGLRVLTCSAFGTAGAPQVAILARDKAILSWVEEISGGQGFAFALLQAGPRKLGVFSMQGQSVPERVLAEVKKLQKFANNRPDAFLIAGAAAGGFREAGFETVASDSQTNSKTTATEFWASNAGFLSRPRSMAIAGIPRPVLITDVDTASSFSSKFAYQTALLFPGESPAPVQAAAPTSALSPRLWPIALAAVVIIGALILFARRRKPSMELVPVSGGDDFAKMNLVTWLKSVFMQRLLSQRQQMIANEAEATGRTLAIEEKLSQLQTALQDRISNYENRIARLETELTAATSENRSLIRDQIDLLKEKVVKAKEEFVYRRN